MDEFFSVLAVIVFVLGMIPSSKKKKKKRVQAGEASFQGAKSQETMAFGDEMLQKQPSQKKPQQRGAAKQKVSVPQGGSPSRVGIPREERPSMQFRSISPSEFASAGEGRDPCHVGGSLDDPHSPVYDSPVDADAQRAEMGRQLLAGVIMSEVLQRPAARKRR